MQDLEGIVGRTSEGVRLNLEVNTTHDLATWALPNELTDHPVSYGGVIQSSFAFCLTPVPYTGVMHRCNFDIHVLWDMLLWLQGRQDRCPFCSFLLLLWHVVFT
jgi:hypothetical protein